jgi:hypothetical protein
LKVTQKFPLARLAAEGVVIVLGVLVALAVDRWVTTFDERGQEQYSIEQLIENLMADSARVSQAITRAGQRRALALQLLDGSSGANLDPVTFLASVERVAWWSPLDYSREAWDDLVATGRLAFIRDRSVRRGLSTYYNRIEWLARVEEAWDTQLMSYENRGRALLPPLKRLQVLGQIPQGGTALPVTQDDVGAVLRRIREDPAISTDLGQVVVVFGVQRGLYGDLLDDIGSLLAILRGAL